MDSVALGIMITLSTALSAGWIWYRMRLFSRLVADVMEVEVRRQDDRIQKRLERAGVTPSGQYGDNGPTEPDSLVGQPFAVGQPIGRYRQ